MNRLLLFATILAISFIGCTDGFDGDNQLPSIPGQDRPEDKEEDVDNSSSIPNNEIWYSSYYGRVVQPNESALFGANIISNTYKDGKGVIVFDKEVLQIGDYAFYNCDELYRVVMPNSTIFIGEYAFKGCVRLSSVTIPKSVQAIGTFAFFNCDKLSNVYISDISAWCEIDFADRNANPLRYAPHLYLNDKLVTQLNIPQNTAQISNWAFYDCDDITSVVVSNDVTHIGLSAFYDCNRLSSIYFSNDSNLESIGGNAFHLCTSLKNINLPNTVEKIGDSVFCNCVSLENISIGDNVIEIGDATFAQCSSLNSIVIPNKIETIKQNTFKDCINLQYISIGKSVSHIGEYAFENCKKLEILDISDISTWCSVTFGGLYSNPLSFATELYLNGVSIQELIIPNGVTYISDGVFQNCSNITSIKIPKSLTKTGWGAFLGSRNIQNVYIEDLEAWCHIEFGASGGNPLLHSNLLLNNELIVDLVIPEGIHFINPHAFQYCNSIISVTIPNSVIRIGDMAFYSCNNLAYVYCNATTPPTIGYNDDTFDYNADGRKIYVYPDCVDAYKTMWQQYAGHIVSSGSTPNIENTTIHYTTIDEKIIYIKNLPIISNDYYSNRDGLMIICGNLSYIPKDTFYDCENLSSIDIPDGIISIGEMAFCGCSNLNNFVIPESVVSIGEYAFSGCYCLENVYCRPTLPPIIDDDVFFNNSSNLKIFVPIESIDLYKSQWDEYSSFIHAYDYTITP